MAVLDYCSFSYLCQGSLLASVTTPTWSVNENRLAVIALHNYEKSYSQIFQLLKPLKISRSFVYRAIESY
jgi:hypothetical protein